MTPKGIVVIDILGLVLIILIVNLIRTHKLHVGYALLWLVSVMGLMITVSSSSLLILVTKAVGAIFPVSALCLLAFVLILLVLIFFSIQLSTLSDRQAELTQTLALHELLTQEKQSEQDISGKEQ